MSRHLRPGPHVLFQDLDAEVVLLNLSSGVYYGAGGVGARVWKLLLEGKSTEEIVAEVVKEYDTTSDPASAPTWPPSWRTWTPPTGGRPRRLRRGGPAGARPAARPAGLLRAIARRPRRSPAGGRAGLGPDPPPPPAAGARRRPGQFRGGPACTGRSRVPPETTYTRCGACPNPWPSPGCWPGAGLPSSCGWGSGGRVGNSRPTPGWSGTACRYSRPPSPKSRSTHWNPDPAPPGGHIPGGRPRGRPGRGASPVTHTAELYGLCVRSDVPLPGSAGTSRDRDVELVRAAPAKPPFEPGPDSCVYRNADGPAAGDGVMEVHHRGAWYALRCMGFVDFYFTEGGRVSYVPAQGVPPEVVVALFVGPGVPSCWSCGAGRASTPAPSGSAGRRSPWPGTRGPANPPWRPPWSAAGARWWATTYFRWRSGTASASSSPGPRR